MFMMHPLNPIELITHDKQVCTNEGQLTLLLPVEHPDFQGDM